MQCNNSSGCFCQISNLLSKKVISALKQCLFWSRERVFSEINCTGNHITSAMVFVPSDGAYVGVLCYLWGDFITDMELTLSWLQRTPLSMFLQNNNSYFLILTKDLNVCSFFFQNKTKACYKENRNIQHSFCLFFHVNNFCWLSLIYVARWNTKRNVYRNWQYYLNMQESIVWIKLWNKRIFYIAIN